MAHMSPIRAAGNPVINTVIDPLTIGCGTGGGGGGTDIDISVTRAAGRPHTSTVTAQGGKIGIGAPFVQGPVCESVTRACGGTIKIPSFLLTDHCHLEQCLHLGQ